MTAPGNFKLSRELIFLVGAASLVLGFNAGDLEPEPVGSPAELAPVEVEVEVTSVEVEVEAKLSRALGAAAKVTPGGTLAIDRHGLLVVERSAGELVRADREGKRLASLKLSPGLGEMVTDGLGRAFVADRAANRILRLDVDHAEQPRELGRGAVFEPHGLALTPDGATLLATSVSEHALVALDAETLALVWEVELGPEPRAVAISADGSHAAVGFLSSGSLALVDLASEGRRIEWHSLEPRDHLELVREDEGCGEDMIALVAQVVEARSRFSVPVETGRRYARGIFALQFMTDGRLVAPHQLVTPQLKRVVARQSADSYGGESDSGIEAIEQQLGWVGGVGGLERTHQTTGLFVKQPRALAYDPANERLYVGGYGDDKIASLDGKDGRQWVNRVVLSGAEACGVDGLAVDDAEHGNELWVHCEFGRKLVRLEREQPGQTKWMQWHEGEALAESARSPEVELGAALFSRNDPRLSDNGNLPCSSCHPEGRSDGLTWRLGPSILQAPMLAGRVVGTAPYKWDGQDRTIQASVRHTTARLGGDPEWVSDAEYAGLVAYLESLPAPKPRQRGDSQAIERGHTVFTEAACDACHEGALSTDRSQHRLDTTLAQVDTPSLIGLAHSRPYFHDGSAPDLRTLLTDRGTVHDMADTSALSDGQLRDLVAYLESL